nr:hypothetical protein [Pseudaminobacter sp.]
MSINSKSMKCTVAAVALAAAALSATPALSDKAELKSMSFNAESANTTIHVISTDGQKWNKLKSGNVQFWGHMKIDTKYPGMIWDAAVVLADCDDSGCNALPRIWSEQIIERDFNDQENFTFDTSKLPVSGTGITLADQIIAQCNAHLQADGPTKSHSFAHELPATLVADTGETWGDVDNIPDEAEFGDWPYPVGEVDETRTD